MPTRLVATLGLAGALLVPSFVAPPSAGEPTVPASGLEAAVTWLAGQQQSDGGFELAGFPGFETSDAVLALAAAGQADATWSEAEARSAVASMTTGGNDPLDALDAWVDETHADGGVTPAAKAQQAAKLIALVAAPLGLDATDFDPAGDSGTPVDLVDILQAAAGGDLAYAALPFGGRVYAAWALGALDLPVPGALLDAIAAAQQANGSFSYTGLADGTDLDPDLAAAVIVARTVAGLPATDVTIRRAVVSLGRTQESTGAWATVFDDGNPSSTALVMVAATTLGSDPDAPCWRDAAEPRFAGIRYPSPSSALLRAQQDDGRVASPNDSFGVNTLATAQTIQGLAAAEGRWPYAGGSCTSASPSHHRRLVNALYLDLLGRFADDAGAAYWAGLLGQGTTPTQVARRLAGTQEYGRRVVDQIVRRYLGRPATLEERTAGGSAVVAGRRLDRIAVVLGGDEYYQAAVEEPASPTDSAWLDALYGDLLGRPVDEGGRTWALGLLGAGQSRYQVARHVLHTTEALGLLIDGTYGQLLRRAADPGGRTYWTSRLQRGSHPELLVAQIAGSSEYVAATRG